MATWLPWELGSGQNTVIGFWKPRNLLKHKSLEILTSIIKNVQVPTHRPHTMIQKRLAKQLHNPQTTIKLPSEIGIQQFENSIKYIWFQAGTTSPLQALAHSHCLVACHYQFPVPTTFILLLISFPGISKAVPYQCTCPTHTHTCYITAFSTTSTTIQTAQQSSTSCAVC